MAEETAVKPEELVLDESLKGLVDAGVFYGRKKSKTHPRVKGMILGNRNGIELINLEKTKEMMEEAVAFLKEKMKGGGTVLFVGTQPPAMDIAEVAKEFGFPYVDKRWLGGTLTNFKVITNRLEYYRKLKNDVENNLLDKYTKKERLGLEKELVRLKEVMEGLEAMHGMPAVLVVVDPNIHMTAVKEAHTAKIPVVSFVNTDSDPDSVDYPVLGNNKSRQSVSWFLENIKNAVKEGRMVAAKAKEEKEQKEKAQ